MIFHCSFTYYRLIHGYIIWPQSQWIFEEFRQWFSSSNGRKHLTLSLTSWELLPESYGNHCLNSSRITHSKKKILWNFNARSKGGWHRPGHSLGEKKDERVECSHWSWLGLFKQRFSCEHWNFIIFLQGVECQPYSKTGQGKPNLPKQFGQWLPYNSGNDSHEIWERFSFL